MDTATETAKPDGKQDSAEKKALAEVMTLFKELTLALIENAKASKALMTVYATGKNEKGEEEVGLIDQLIDLEEAVDRLDGHFVGMNVMLSRVNFVGDRMLSIYKGSAEEPADPNATPPVPATPAVAGRAPSLADICDALDEFDKNLEEEAAAAVVDADAELQPGEFPDEPEGAEQTQPPKHPMIANTPPPGLKKLPPPPVMKP